MAHRHATTCGSLIFAFFLLYFVLVFSLAPYSEKKMAYWQPGDGVQLNLHGERWSSVRFTARKPNATAPYTVAKFAKLPPRSFDDRNFSFGLGVDREDSLVLPMQLNKGTNFTISWATNWTVLFYIFSESDYNDWKNPSTPTGGVIIIDIGEGFDDDFASFSSTSSLASSSSSSSSSSSPSSSSSSSSSRSHNVVKKSNVKKATNGTHQYRVKDTGRYYLVWDASKSKSAVAGAATVSGQFAVYGDPRNPCQGAKYCCNTSTVCRVDLDRTSSDVVILSVSPDPAGLFYTIGAKTYGNFAWWYGIYLGAVVGGLVTVIILVFVLCLLFTCRKGRIQYESLN